jgi:hypothetical protein
VVPRRVDVVVSIWLGSRAGGCCSTDCSSRPPAPTRTPSASSSAAPATTGTNPQTTKRQLHSNGYAGHTFTLKEPTDIDTENSPHSPRSGDRIVLAAYLGKSDTFDLAVASPFGGGSARAAFQFSARHQFGLRRSGGQSLCDYRRHRNP